MADYDENGNPIPPPDAESARESAGYDSSGDAQAQPVWDSGIGDAVVTVQHTASNSLLGLIFVIGALYFLMKDGD